MTKLKGVSFIEYTKQVYYPALLAALSKPTIPTKQKLFLEKQFKNPMKVALGLDRKMARDKEEAIELWNIYLNIFCTILSQQHIHETQASKKLNNKLEKYAKKIKESHIALCDDAFIKLVEADPLWLFEPELSDYFITKFYMNDKQYFTNLGEALASQRNKAFPVSPTGEKTIEALHAMRKYAYVKYPILPPGQTLIYMKGKEEIKNNGELAILIQKDEGINPDTDIDAKFVKTIRERYDHKFKSNAYWDIIEAQKKLSNDTPKIEELLSNIFKNRSPLPFAKSLL